MHANELILYVADQALRKAFYADVLGLAPAACSSGLVSRSNWATAARTVKISSREGVVVSSCSRRGSELYAARPHGVDAGGGRGGGSAGADQGARPKKTSPDRAWSRPSSSRRALTPGDLVDEEPVGAGCLQVVDLERFVLVGGRDSRA